MFAVRQGRGVLDAARDDSHFPPWVLVRNGSGRQFCRVFKGIFMAGVYQGASDFGRSGFDEGFRRSAVRAGILSRSPPPHPLSPAVGEARVGLASFDVERDRGVSCTV